MSTEQKCENCNQSFLIDDYDLAFYERIAPSFGAVKCPIPPPRMCAPCRMQRRLLFRNFFNLYKSKSSLSGQEMISMYAPGAPFPVYTIEEWWGDGWSALDYSLDFSFDRSVFQVLAELHKTVPRMRMHNSMCENTGYCNFSFQSKDCYLVFGNVENEDCCYGHIVWRSKNCFDCLYTYKSELCFECVDCVDCYNLAYCTASENCSDSRFLYHCNGCRDCFGCVGLKNEQYSIFNESYSQAEYMSKLAELDTGNLSKVSEYKEKIKELSNNLVVKHYHGISSENVIGDYLYNCRNTFDSFDAKNCEDIRYCATIESFIDCHDCNFSPERTELTYNCISVIGYNILFCHTSTNSSSELIYCDNCYSCSNCFGCAGLKNESYCIFNKKHTEQEYNELVPKIIEYMNETGEWGEFFPKALSPFGYNETMSNQYFPLDRELVLEQGYTWQEKDLTEYKPASHKPAAGIKEVSDGILKELLVCESCGKNYKIIQKELEFCRSMNVPVQQKCFDCRHNARMKLRNPRKLIERDCEKCGKSISSTYSQTSPEIVYCESCYLSEVF